MIKTVNRTKEKMSQIVNKILKIYNSYRIYHKIQDKVQIF